MPSLTVHDRFVSTATRLIDRHGRDAALVSMERTGGDPWAPTLEEVVTPVVLVQTQLRASEVDGELIQVNDVRFLLDSSVEPTTDMRLRDGDVDYSIVDVDPVKPGTTTIIYKVQARL